VAVKTEGTLNARMLRIAVRLSPVVAALTIAGLAASLSVRPDLTRNFRDWPAGWVLPAVVAAGLFGMPWFASKRREKAAFICSSAYIMAMLGGAAFALYPTLLPATTAAAHAITIHNAAAGPESLSVGLVWWSVGMAIAVGYFVLVYRLFAGKVRAGGHY
jgi:cytochrome d ubiquinol oxidase subunit II